MTPDCRHLHELCQKAACLPYASMVVSWETVDNALRDFNMECPLELEAAMRVTALWKSFLPSWQSKLDEAYFVVSVRYGPETGKRAFTGLETHETVKIWLLP